MSGPGCGRATAAKEGKSEKATEFREIMEPLVIGTIRRSVEVKELARSP
jgi:hypothetical protein